MPVSQSDIQAAARAVLNVRDESQVHELQRRVTVAKTNVDRASVELAAAVKDRAALETLLIAKRAEGEDAQVTLCLNNELREARDNEERLRGKIRKLEQEHVGLQDRLSRWKILRAKLP